jgi:hypothetical protein
MADDIDTVCKRMVADANAQLDKYEKAQIKSGVKKPNSMRTFLSGNPTSGVRTPEQQAAEVLAGRSWTCNSSHVADAARHVGPVLNGKKLTEMSPLKKAVSEEDYKKFVEVYADAMKKQGLRNFDHGPNFLPSSQDPLHMELKDSRLPENDPRIETCRLIYAKATREDGKGKNAKFEKDNQKWLDDYDKKHPNPADADAGA